MGAFLPRRVFLGRIMAGRGLAYRVLPRRILLFGLAYRVLPRRILVRLTLAWRGDGIYYSLSNSHRGYKIGREYHHAPNLLPPPRESSSSGSVHYPS